MHLGEGILPALQALAWWDWDHALLKERLESFSGSAEAFVERWGAQ